MPSTMMEQITQFDPWMLASMTTKAEGDPIIRFEPQFWRFCPSLDMVCIEGATDAGIALSTLESVAPVYNSPPFLEPGILAFCLSKCTTTLPSRMGRPVPCILAACCDDALSDFSAPMTSECILVAFPSIANPLTGLRCVLGSQASGFVTIPLVGIRAVATSTAIRIKTTLARTILPKSINGCPMLSIRTPLVAGLNMRPVLLDCHPETIRGLFNGTDLTAHVASDDDFCPLDRQYITLWGAISNLGDIEQRTRPMDLFSLPPDEAVGE